MSVALEVMDEELTGWGLAQSARCQVVRPETVAALADVFAEAAREGKTVALRGAGCSYGDAALNNNALVLDCSRLNRILAWDATSGQITVEPGVTIAQLWRRTLPDGWWPMVVPGTSAATVGGAAAMQIHGKNNWHAGAFGESVLAFDLLLPSGETLTCSSESNSDLFAATFGAMGLLGAFTSLTLQTRRVYSGTVWEITTAHGSLDEVIAALDEATSWATDLVAWIDTSARGKRLGRGLLKMARDLARRRRPPRTNAHRGVSTEPQTIDGASAAGLATTTGQATDHFGGAGSRIAGSGRVGRGFVIAASISPLTSPRTSRWMPSPTGATAIGLAG